MKKPPFVPYFLVLALVLIFLAGCGPKEPGEEYPAEIKTVDGVKSISNPDFPKDGTIHYVMEEELSIGVLEGDEEYMLNMPQDVKVSEDGTIYVLDWGDVCIKVFDDKGVYLCTIGRKGQGPGEFDTPAFYDISPDGRVFIMDTRNRRVVIFGVEGEYLGGFRLEGFYLGMKTDDQNRMYFEKEMRKGALEDLPVTKDFQEIEVINQIIRSRPDGSDRFVLGEFEGEKDRVKRTPTGGTMSVGSEYNIVWEVSRDGMLYEGLNNEYKINIFNPDGTKVMTFSREYEPVLLVRRMDDMVVKNLMPAYDPRKGFEFDGKGNLWVAFFSENEEENAYDVFSPEGIYVKQVIVPYRIFEFFKGKVYSIVSTEEGFIQVKRFKLVTPG
jgi:sugar lactone lactonase YvrE